MQKIGTLFNDKINRKSYIIRSIVIFIASILGYVIVAMSVFSQNIGTGVLALSLLFSLIQLFLVIYIIMSTAQRLNDLGHSTWFCLVMLIPYLNIVAWIYLCIATRENDFFKNKA